MAEVRRRACLVVPGSSPRKLAKAAEVGADEVVIDLEDAVAPEAKREARAAVAAALPGWRAGAVAVRVNAPGTPWHDDDVRAIAAAPADTLSLVVPKVESGSDLERVARLVEEHEDGARPVRVEALIETAAGLRHVDAIAGGSPRLDALILGYADLEASLGGHRSLDAWLPVQHALVLAARVAGVQAVDGPYLAVDTGPAFEAAAARAAELGFDGKWAIHPSQVDPLLSTFTPSEDELTRAHAILDAIADARRSGVGAVELDGQMLDEALAAQARRTLARAGEERDR
jgi:citrate lyase subunit beta/citryl-CoA lyase